MNDYILITMTDDWADEMKLNAFIVIPLAEHEENLRLVKQENHFPYSVPVGTNEYVEYESFEDWVGHMEGKIISQEYAKFLFDIFDFEPINEGETVDMAYGFYELYKMPVDYAKIGEDFDYANDGSYW